MQIVSQETFLQAESEGQLFLDHQFAMIQCINDWRIKVFETFQLNMNSYIPRLQLDIQVIKSALVHPENNNKVNFTLGQIGVMDILRMNFKSCQKRLKVFLIDNKDNLSFNLVSDLMKNTQILREYFSYDKSFENPNQSEEGSAEQQFYEQEQNSEQHSAEEEIQLDFNTFESNTKTNYNTDNANTCAQEDFNSIFDQPPTITNTNSNNNGSNSNSNDFFLELEENYSNNNNSAPNAQELFNNFFEQEISQPQQNCGAQNAQFYSNNNYSQQHFILLE